MLKILLRSMIVIAHKNYAQTHVNPARMLVIIVRALIFQSSVVFSVKLIEINTRRKKK
uniref:Uncharacterized protein n=2 Tax=Meloidogyne TaxID=189290 RepID=A0A6V7TL47_MELEN|nr:unnamed protein product [Meloidogyne enterolobii]